MQTEYAQSAKRNKMTKMLQIALAVWMIFTVPFMGVSYSQHDGPEQAPTVDVTLQCEGMVGDYLYTTLIQIDNESGYTLASGDLEGVGKTVTVDPNMVVIMIPGEGVYTVYAYPTTLIGSLLTYSGQVEQVTCKYLSA